MQWMHYDALAGVRESQPEVDVLLKCPKLVCSRGRDDVAIVM